MAICVGRVREDGQFQFFSGRYAPDDVPIFVDTVHGAARFKTTQDPAILRFEQRMHELKLTLDYRYILDGSEVLALHPDVSARLSELLHPNAVTIFADQAGHGLTPDPRVHIYEWTGDAGPPGVPERTAKEARDNPKFVLTLPGWHGRTFLTPQDAASLKSFLDEHGVRHGVPWEEDPEPSA
jgi:hypothetical protein